jgi:hypothetical protein
LTTGGGSNFGVATEFTFKARPQRNTVWSGIVAFLPHQVSDFVAAFNQYRSVGGQDPKATCTAAVMCLPGNPSPVLALTPFYDGSEEDGRRAFKPFYDIGPIEDQTQSLTYYQMVLFIVF